MRTRAMRRVTARYTWDRLRVSFWFAPAILALLAVLLAWAVYWLDGQVPNELLADSRFILTGSVDDSRVMLVGIATTVLTTAGVVFTLLTLPLSTVAAQYGSRLLRVFLGDRTTQFVLGMFVGTFVYCLAAATTIAPAEIEPDAPQLTVTVGLALMMATFGTLILLVQHISIMLQAPNIAAAASAELLGVVGVENPGEAGTGEIASPATPVIGIAMPETEAYTVRSRHVGYIQTLDPEILLAVAQERDLVVRLVHKPGDYVWEGEEVALVWPASRFNAQLEKQLRRSIRVGNQRTPTQDIECAVNQLVEMAVRAMSPAINDPFTAMTCLDHMGIGLVLFAQQAGENLNTYDQNGQLRLVFEPVTFEELLRAAFDMLRHASCDNATVLLYMLDVIHMIGQEIATPDHRQLLLDHARLIELESHAGALIEPDRQRVQQRANALAVELAAAA
ncbi:MAG: DUF2254 domain-containing protein [Chloroflexota bacterium]